MAFWKPNHSEEPLYVSPELPPSALMMEWSDGFRGEELQQHHHHLYRTAAYEHHVPSLGQQISSSFQQHSQQPLHAVDLHSTSGIDWTTPLQHVLPNLPPTPISPYSPLEPLNDMGNPRFTGQHRGDWDLGTFPVRNMKHPGTPGICQVGETLNHRQSAPNSSDVDPPFLAMTKCKTDPGEVCKTDTTSSCDGHPHRRSLASGTGRRSSVQHSYIGLGREQHHHQSQVSRRSSMQSISQQSTRTRVPHNLVERRYRDNLNNQIEDLRLTLPSLRDAQSISADTEDVAAMGPRMPSKAVIISTAATYIKDLETERERLLSMTKALQEQVSSLQKLVRS